MVVQLSKGTLAALKAHETRRVNYAKPGAACCAECMTAVGDDCECPCGGVNHGMLRGPLTI